MKNDDFITRVALGIHRAFAECFDDPGNWAEMSPEDRSPFMLMAVEAVREWERPSYVMLRAGENVLNDVADDGLSPQEVVRQVLSDVSLAALQEDIGSEEN